MFQLFLFYKNVDLVLPDLIVSRYRLRFIVARAVTSFRSPWRMLTSSSPPAAHVALVPLVTRFFFFTFSSTKMTALFAVFPPMIISGGPASVNQASFHIKVGETFYTRGQTTHFDLLMAILLTNFAPFFPLLHLIFQLSLQQWHLDSGSQEQQQTSINHYSNSNKRHNNNNQLRVRKLSRSTSYHKVLNHHRRPIERLWSLMAQQLRSLWIHFR
jgi:hypothetical protein